MPLIGSRIPDRRGLQMLSRWIQELPSDGENVPPPALKEPSTAQALARVRDPNTSAAELAEAWQFLLGTPNRALALLTVMNERPSTEPLPNALIQLAAKHASYQVRDLFERFLPEDLRPHKLGPAINPDVILSLRGDAARGRTVFLKEEVQCTRCHRLQGEGREFGPDLSQIGKKYSRGQVLDQILNPSKTIDPAFVSYQVEAKNGSYNGLILKRTAEELLLKDSDLNVHRFPTGEVKSVQAQQLSAMPEGLLQSMTAQDAADLIEYLSSQR
jgi:putative heme-binding domain-containing protein